MAKKPILILQMQRMGDMILSFPLFLWLHRAYPGHPLWVVGEPRFYNPLLPLSPAATYHPWSTAHRLRNDKLALCINLSHAPGAAVLAGEMLAEETLGAVRADSAKTHVLGKWHLYRTGLVHANRHNRFHWAELNALDCIDLRRIRETQWSPPRSRLGDRRRIGLFLGASDAAKCPDPAFWAGLARELLHRDLRPILLGGPDDKSLGQEVQRRLGRKILNLTGRLNLAQFANFGQSLELMVTPDTGPMHLAAWSGLRVLNLSMGPVNPWETGPYQPGHTVSQVRISCAGCWQCIHEEAKCTQRFFPRRIAQMVGGLVIADTLPQPRYSGGMTTFTTGRSPLGLYALCPTAPRGGQPDARELLDAFWTAFWGQAFGLWTEQPTRRCWQAVLQDYPELAAAFIRSLLGFHRKLGQAREESFWRQGPPMLRPLFSQVHVGLQNGDFSAGSERAALKITEELLHTVKCT